MQDVQILMQALPYIREHRGKTFLLKFGGALVEDREALASLASDIALLTAVGIRICVVHGGGPQATALAGRLGLEAQFVEGRRITDEGTLEVAKMVFAGKINLEVLAALRGAKLKAVGLSGVSGDLIHAVRRAPTEYTDDATGEKKLVDMGHVGDITDVDTSLLKELMDTGHVPVVASLAADRDGNVLNINADTVATRLAMHLGADKLMFLTNVDGVLRDPQDPSTRISAISAREIEELIADGTIGKGMIPKVQNAIDAARSGVSRVHVLNGEKAHTLLIELFTTQGAGTLITRHEEHERYLGER